MDPGRIQGPSAGDRKTTAFLFSQVPTTTWSGKGIHRSVMEVVVAFKGRNKKKAIARGGKTARITAVLVQQWGQRRVGYHLTFDLPSPCFSSPLSPPGRLWGVRDSVLITWVSGLGVSKVSNLTNQKKEMRVDGERERNTTMKGVSDHKISIFSAITDRAFA